MNLDTVPSAQFCSFYLAERLFGIDILDVKEVSNNLSICPIPHAPQQILGYLNIRGMIHLVIDLRQLFHYEAANLNDSCRIVLFKSAIDEPFGIVVDRMGEIVSLDHQNIVNRRFDEDDKIPEQVHCERRQIGQDLCLGVTKLQEQIMLIVNSKAIISSVKQAQNDSKLGHEQEQSKSP